VPTLDQMRAQVLFCLLQRAVTDPRFPTAHGKRRTETHIVITLDTLLGLREDPGTINGVPVPGPIARELATDSSVLRRLVTDPVTGHLLDLGRKYQPSAELTDYLIARDERCRVPHCRIRASACDLDHAIPFDPAGPTSATNMGALCRGDHSPKTAGYTDITDSSNDGSATYVTVLGQRIPIPPRPVMIDPTETAEMEPAEPEDDGPLPF
jgi:hypothetical protein